MLKGKKLEKIKGIAYRKKDKIKINKRPEFIKNLDLLPFPAYSLYDIKKYKTPSAIDKKKSGSMGWNFEGGVIFGCIYCNKSCFGRTFRVKIPRKSSRRIFKDKKTRI